MVPLQVKLHPLVTGQVGTLWFGGAGPLRPALPLRPHLQPAHGLHPPPLSPRAGRLPHRFRVRPVSRVPGWNRWEFVGAVVTEELAEAVNRAEIHRCSSGPQQNLHHPRVTAHYCTGRISLSHCSFLTAWRNDSWSWCLFGGLYRLKISFIMLNLFMI